MEDIYRREANPVLQGEQKFYRRPVDAGPPRCFIALLAPHAGEMVSGDFGHFKRGLFGLDFNCIDQKE